MSDVLILGEVKEGSLDMKTVELLEAGKKLSTDHSAPAAASRDPALATALTRPADRLPALRRRRRRAKPAGREPPRRAAMRFPNLSARASRNWRR